MGTERTHLAVAGGILANHPAELELRVGAKITKHDESVEDAIVVLDVWLRMRI